MANRGNTLLSRSRLHPSAEGNLRSLESNHREPAAPPPPDDDADTSAQLRPGQSARPDMPRALHNAGPRKAGESSPAHLVGRLDADCG
eukprot:CAMPEP_0180510950 /NCGR_PEP_ID=MMETSP1036_2-20121128/50705_1 /TAXON_ID=632150 /ORGANISM="Azadinium spinosum, Strain 3D9" /LENGTH=87 /DNA_ID=CAMNT_0022521811 /DNA_START=360 /DNA_END=620 /DNA_ORIENTATION=+